jgi:hypothetical protein
MLHPVTFPRTYVPVVSKFGAGDTFPMPVPIPVHKDDGPPFTLIDAAGVVVARAGSPMPLLRMAIQLQTPLRVRYMDAGCEIWTNRRRGETKKQTRTRLHREIVDAATQRSIELDEYRARMLKTYGGAS